MASTECALDPFLPYLLLILTCGFVCLLKGSTNTIGLDQPKPRRTGGIDRPDGPLEKPADVNLLRSSTTYSVGHRQPQIKNKTREHDERGHGILTQGLKRLLKEARQVQL